MESPETCHNMQILKSVPKFNYHQVWFVCNIVYDYTETAIVSHQISQLIPKCAEWVEFSARWPDEDFKDCIINYEGR